MKVLTIMGTAHKGNTRAIVDLFLKEFEKVGFKTKFFFKLFGMTQKNGWNKVDADYWKKNGWLDGKKPY